MKTITELQTKYPGSIIQTIGTAYHAPGRPMSNCIHKRTFDMCIIAIKNGEKIYIGNSPHGDGKMIAKTNSRFHGKSIRTIRSK